ncbi:DUF2510 domain-containing protein [Rhodococcus wratislaviensis]|uniref:DUF2510 domain-containing protein n=1 Tax=Rhodococcus wratislaviensis TaxID=44752 RepID=UPI00055A6AB6
MTTPTPSPGWHPDPEGTPQLRWWDGTQWTSATKPRALQETRRHRPRRSIRDTEAEQRHRRRPDRHRRPRARRLADPQHPRWWKRTGRIGSRGNSTEPLGHAPNHGTHHLCGALDVAGRLHHRRRDARLLAPS